MNRTRRAVLAGLALGSAAGLPAQPLPTASAAAASAPGSDAERLRDAAAFGPVESQLANQLTDVQSVVVLLRGRPAYAFHRNGDPQTLHPTQSVAKSAMAALVGIALQQGQLRSVHQPVVELVPDWVVANADPRAAAITLHHLLTMTSGFAIDDPTGTAPGLPAREAWARPLAHAPGQAFAYDNSIISLLWAVLEKATGMPLPDYAREHLVRPLAMAEPGYGRGLQLRTLDMARLGQLYLQSGQWEGSQILPEAFATASVQPQNAGGPPAGLAYGYLWWVVPGKAPRPTFLASGYSGQFIWVHPALELVVATSSTVSPDVQRRGQALQLIRGPLFSAAQQRVKAEAR